MGTQNISAGSNTFLDSPDYRELDEKLDRKANRDAAVRSAAVMAGDAALPGLGTAIGIVDSFTDRTKDEHGIYKSKGAEVLDRISPIHKTKALFSGDRDEILDAATFGIAGKSSSDKAKELKKKAEVELNQRVQNRKYAGTDSTSFQSSKQFRRGTSGVSKYTNGLKKAKSIVSENDKTYDETKAPKDGDLLLPDVNRPSYKNKEGQIVSENKITVGFDDGEYVIPTVVNGKQLSEEEAVAEFKRTGLHMGKFNSSKDADISAQKRTMKYNVLADPVRNQSEQIYKKGTSGLNKNGVKNTLWNNIRANRGSGRKPTAQMLEQEKKIKASDKYEKGGEVWTRKEGQDPDGGLNAKGRAAYNKKHNANLKPPQPEGGSRRDSFCARMKGMKRKLTSAKTANDPNSRINKSLRAWKCKTGCVVTNSENMKTKKYPGGVAGLTGLKGMDLSFMKDMNVPNSTTTNSASAQSMGSGFGSAFQSGMQSPYGQAALGLVNTFLDNQEEKRKKRRDQGKINNFPTTFEKGGQVRSGYKRQGKFKNRITGGEGFNVDNTGKAVTIGKKLYNNRRSDEEFAKLRVGYSLDGIRELGADELAAITDKSKLIRVRVGDGKYGDNNSLYRDNVPQPVSPPNRTPFTPPALEAYPDVNDYNGDTEAWQRDYANIEKRNRELRSKYKQLADQKAENQRDDVRPEDIDNNRYTGVGVSFEESKARRDAYKKRKLGEQSQLENTTVAEPTSSIPKQNLEEEVPVFSKGGRFKYKQKQVIEIEGKKTPEIHTSEDFELKNLGTVPHSKGGNKVVAEEGDIVFPTQNNPEKFKHIAELMKMKASGTEEQKAYAVSQLEKERRKLPADKGSKYPDGTKKVKKGRYKTTSIQTPDKLPTGTNADYITRNQNRKDRRSIYNKLGTFKNRATGRTGIQTGNPAFNNQLSDAEFNSDKYQQTAQFVVYDKTTNKPIPYDSAVHKREDAVRVIKGAKGELLVDHDANQKPPLELKGQGIGKTDWKVPNTNFSRVPDAVTSPEKAKDVASKKGRSDFPVYVNEINNFARANQRLPKRQERYLSPELMQYSDMSENLRNDVRNISAADKDNSRNLSGGSAANARSNFSRAGAERSQRMAAIQEAETQRAMNIQNANVGIKNQTQQLNLGRFDAYQQAREQDQAVRTAYADTAVKGMDDKLQVERKDRNQAIRDKEILKHLRTENYRYDEEGNLIPMKKKGSRCITSNKPKYKYGK